MISGPKPRSASALIIKVWSMESKAFLKSISKMRPAFFLSVMCLIKFIKFIRTLPILLVWMYAFCWRPMIDVTAGFMRCVMAQEASL